MPFDENYMKALREKGSKSKVYQEFQLTGLTISEILGDNAHAGLYIKLAKQFDANHLLSIAKRVAETKNIKKKGAYFMRVLLSKDNKSNGSR